MFSKILATASYVPETKRTNADLERMLGTDLDNGGTTDKWIMERVGIKERRIAQPHESHLYMATDAIKRAVEKAGINPAEASIILAGNTHIPDVVPCAASKFALGNNMAAFDVITSDASYAAEASSTLFKSIALRNQDKLIEAWDKGDFAPEKNAAKYGIIYQHKRTALAQIIARELGMNAEKSYDLVTGCASYNFALALADAAIKSKPQNIIVAAVDKMNGVVNEKDRNTIVLFGELASATVLGPSKEAGFLAHCLETDGRSRDLITVKDGYFWQDGKAVYKWAVPKIIELTRSIVEETRDIGGNRLFLVPHQANLRMIDAARKNDVFKNVYGVVVTGDMFGNSSTASIAHALDVLMTEGIEIKRQKIKPEKGDYIGIEGFGAGLSSGANVYRVA